MSLKWQSPYVPPPGASTDTSLPRVLLEKDIVLPDEHCKDLTKSAPTPLPRTSKLADNGSPSMVDTEKKPPIIPRVCMEESLCCILNHISLGYKSFTCFSWFQRRVRSQHSYDSTVISPISMTTVANFKSYIHFVRLGFGCQHILKGTQ